MTKIELEKKVARKTKYGQQYVHYVLNTAYETILEALEQHEEVAIRGIGIFRPLFKPSHKHRMPNKKTMYYDVPDRYVVKFQQSKRMIKAVNGEEWRNEEED